VRAANDAAASALAPVWLGPDRTADPIATITTPITSALHSRMTIGY
jgi:hypothetical protein